MSPFAISQPMASDDDVLTRARRLIDDKEVLRLARDLIRVTSITKHEEAVSERIFTWLDECGLSPRSVPVEGHGPCVVAEVGPRKAPAVVLNGHMDTVEVMNGWRHDPFGAAVEGGLLYGLGALDMKSGLAAMMIAFRSLARSEGELSSRVAFQSVSGEEGTSAGTRALIDKGLMRNAKAVIVGEGFGGLRAITMGRRGGSYFNMDVIGRAAHGSKPEDGISAVSDAARIVCALDGMRLKKAHGLVADDFLPLKESQTVLRISGGSDTLTVPETCRLRVIRCTIPNSGDVAEDLARTIRGLGLRSTVTMELEDGPGDLFHPHLTPRDSELVRVSSRWIKRLTGRSPRLVIGRSEADDNIIAHDAGVPVVCFGAGESGELARYHQPEEAVHVAQLATASRAYYAASLGLAT